MGEVISASFFVVGLPAAALVNISTCSPAGSWRRISSSKLEGVLGEVQPVQAAHHLPEGGQIQRLLFAEGQGHVVGDGGAGHVQDVLLHVHAVQHLAALLVDDLALLVHDVVVFQHGLTGLEVPGFHGGLGVFNGLGEHLALDGGVLVQIHFSIMF
jgi:hypothetical protein